MGTFQPNRRKRDRPLQHNAAPRLASRAINTPSAQPTLSSSASASSTPRAAVDYVADAALHSASKPIPRRPPLRSVPPPPALNPAAPPATRTTSAVAPRTPAFHPSADPQVFNVPPKSANGHTSTLGHRPYFSPAFAPSASIEGLRELYELLKFLQESNRETCLQQFVTEVWKIYNAKYRRKRNSSGPAPMPDGQKPNGSNLQSIQTPRHSSNVRPQPSKVSNTITDVICLDDDNDDFAAPKTEFNTPHRKNPHRSSQSDSLTANVQALGVPQAKDQCRLSDPKPQLRDRRFARQYPIDRLEKVGELIEKRYRYFSSKMSRPEQHFSEEDRSYNIWKPSDPSHPIIKLREDLISACFRREDGKAYELHLEAFRFLWYYLVENPCSGAVFVHGIGYPRAHLLFGFADLLVGKKPLRENFKMLIVCPNECLHEWEWAQQCFVDFIQVRILEKQSCFESIDEWQKLGGLLICSFTTFMFMTENVNPALQARARAAFCNPGPDLFVLDEATRLGLLAQRMSTTLRDIRTSSRLAMTSVPLSSNFARAWSIIDWACPRFLGPCLSFWNTFVKPLTDAVNTGRDFKANDEVFQIDRCLRNMLAMVSFGPSFVMREETLFQSARYIQESIIHVHMHKEHRIEYRRLLKAFATAIRESTCSSIAAAQLLSIFSSIGVAALPSLQEECKEQDRDRSPHSKTVCDPLPFHVSLLRSVLPILENSFLKSMPWAKLDALRQIAGTCLVDNERLVVFVCSESLSQEVFFDLKRDPIFKGKLIRRLDVKEEPKTRREILHEFNTATDGSVLIAPYGPNVDLMEGAGWCFVNATRIVFMNTVWHTAAYVQAVNRVHNFAQRSNTVYIHHIVAVDSIEEALCKLKLSSSPFAGEEQKLDLKKSGSKETLISLKLLPKFPMRFFDEISVVPKLSDRTQAKLDHLDEKREQWRDHFNFLTPLTHVLVKADSGPTNRENTFLVRSIDIEKGLYQSCAAGLEIDHSDTGHGTKKMDIQRGAKERRTHLLYEQRLCPFQLVDIAEMEVIEFDRERTRTMSLMGNEDVFDAEIDVRNDIRSSWVEYRRLYENSGRAIENPPCQSENGFESRKRKRTYFEGDNNVAVPRRFE